MKTILRPAVSLFILLSIITGLLYPLLTTGIAKAIFPLQAGGSLIERDHQLIGSSLIGQSFSSARYFWGRPSATSPMPYNGLSSGGSNFSNGNPAQHDAVLARIEALHQVDPDNHQPIPVDLVTASGSGLDPEISPAAAAYQSTRIARVRNLRLDVVQRLIAAAEQKPQWGVFGEARVNVLQLNLALDKQK